MRYRCSLGIALIALMILRPMPAIAQIFPLPIPLQQSESSIDSNGCLHLQASAIVNAQIDGVFDGLSKPEQLYGGFRLVFVQVPETRESRFTNTWSVTSPFEKIVEFYGQSPTRTALLGRIRVCSRHSHNFDADHGGRAPASAARSDSGAWTCRRNIGDRRPLQHFRMLAFFKFMDVIQR
jgi:hypothetical protein